MSEEAGGGAPTAEPTTAAQFFSDRASGGGLAAVPAPAPEPDGSLPDGEPAIDPEGVEAPDAAEAGEVAPEDMLHGMPKAEILKAIEEGRLPDELYRVLKRTAKYGDDELEETLEESLQAGLRHADYTRKLEQVHQQRREAEATIEDTRQIFAEWRAAEESGNTKALRRGLHELNLWGAVEVLLREEAQHRLYEARLRKENPDAYLAHMENKRMRIEQERLEAEAAKQRREQGRKSRGSDPIMARKIEREVTRLFGEHKLDGNSPFIKEQFGRAVRAYRADRPDADPLEIVRLATEATADHVAELTRRLQSSQQQPKKPAGGPSAAHRTAAPAPARKAARNQPATVQDFFNRRRGIT